MRGVEKAESETVTSCMLGEYRSNAVLRAEFLELTQKPSR
jgi:GTP cyclohydrolase I